MGHMESAVLIVKNISREGPGLLERVLMEHEISYNAVDLSQGQAFPPPVNYQAVIVLGGPDSANDTTEKMAAELVQVKAAVEQGIPYLGIDLGMQVLVKAVGGKVVPAAKKELGFTDAANQPYSVTLTAAGKQDALCAGLPEQLGVFQLHGETVELAGDMQLLATGRDCPNQIVKVGARAYGIQPHFELTEPILHTWLGEDPDLKPLGVDKVLADFARQRGTYTVTGLTLFRNFLNIAELI
jgi:GMP synthase (glutamine-hydrolysing)